MDLRPTVNPRGFDPHCYQRPLDSKIKNFDLTLALIVLGTATIGKVGGVWLGAKISKLSDCESLTVGFGMNARGAVGIILVTSAYQTGIIDERVYVALLVMAVFTSLISGPMMKMILKN